MTDPAEGLGSDDSRPPGPHWILSTDRMTAKTSPMIELETGLRQPLPRGARTSRMGRLWLSPDGRRLIAHDDRIELWDRNDQGWPAEPKIFATNETGYHVGTSVVGPHGRFGVLLTWNELSIQTLPDGDTITLRQRRAGQGYIWTRILSPDGRSLALIAQDRRGSSRLEIWRLPTPGTSELEFALLADLELPTKSRAWKLVPHLRSPELYGRKIFRGKPVLAPTLTPPEPVLVRCQGNWHTLRQSDGQLLAHCHEPRHVEREEVLKELGGTPTGCARQILAWRTTCPSSTGGRCCPN